MKNMTKPQLSDFNISESHCKNYIAYCEECARIDKKLNNPDLGLWPHICISLLLATCFVIYVSTNQEIETAKLCLVFFSCFLLTVAPLAPLIMLLTYPIHILIEKAVIFVYRTKYKKPQRLSYYSRVEKYK